MSRKSSATVLFLLTIITMLSVFISLEASAQSNNYKITGYIKPGFISSTTQESALLSDFTIALEGTDISALTDSNGYFELKNIPFNSSSYSINIAKNGYLKRTISDLQISSDIILSSKSSPVDLWPGDVNNDSSINMSDVIQFSFVFNIVKTNEKYNPRYDFNLDGSINMSDILILARYFSKTNLDYPNNINPITVSLSPTNTPTPLPTSTPTPSPSNQITGNVTYTLIKVNSPTADQIDAYNKITAAMDKAVWYYNHYTTLTKKINVYYEPSVSTADGNINGTIRFGKRDYMNHITAMHEIAHTLGIGTSTKYTSLIVNKIFTGTKATNQLRAITGNQQDTLHGDNQHFWPYGLNYTSEVKSDDDLVNHCKIVNCMIKDMGM